jgi:hypothetical protein
MKTLEMSVKNMGFLIDRLGADCGYLQYIRELTQNALEAIHRTKEKGTVSWQRVPPNIEKQDHQLKDKLCVLDTGDGMSAKELVSYINNLSASGDIQSIHGRYGMGAKIAGLTRNPAGLLYLSWQNGQGSMIHAWKDKQGRYGLKALPGPNNSLVYVLPLSDEAKPPEIKDHGTVVILLGQHKDDRTLYAPVGMLNQSRWITFYLNSRYFNLSEKIALYAPYDYQATVSRRITGMKKFLDVHKTMNGKVLLGKATAHWWVLEIKGDNPQIPSKGHLAAIFDNELYEMTKPGKPSVAALQHFGIYYGASQVVIYVEPDKTKNRVTTDTARTKLFIDEEPLPWIEWAQEFCEKMPPELHQFVESKASRSSAAGAQESLEERLSAVSDLLKLKRYHPDRFGHFEVTLFDEEGPRKQKKKDKNKPAKPKKPRGHAGEKKLKKKLKHNPDFYATIRKPRGQSAELTSAPLPVPTIIWQSENECQLLDRAARYIANRNTLIVNRDFRAIKDMIERRTLDHANKAGSEMAARESVESWFSLSLAEAVLGINALYGSPEWSPKDVEAALSEESLTAIVMHRYHVVNAVKRDMSAKFGATKQRIKGATHQDITTPPEHIIPVLGTSNELGGELN